ncbi:precorrin-6Y C5,15-methyltransferase (decarboxylating) [Alkalibaculum bacchi]|uniref:Precorrin-6Y C5,15-methyltransferase (Decarboxylating) n=1 Tax=Alkalibaculum bacchi TaxID=645887 RepID=A0A366ICC3_9FIRM|nr:precorrin-6y C5,15-methyltransferase (decarboxylating) subunit CbiE [Alkalibaculum bacchi]RBP68416.1 precorrin-6Y C5,15-methyltransferase (decarboxylating) [Alkalibaculum bacchi]
MKYNHIDVIGLGPGHPDYILPAGLKKIKEADVLIAGERNLEGISTSGKEVLIIRNNLKQLIEYINKNYHDKKIGVLVSGDPGYHSMLSYIKKNTQGIEVRVTPGISSFTYFFSKLSLVWQDAVLSSVHGEDTDFIKLVEENKKVFFLTDQKITPNYMANELMKKGITHKRFFIGERLSYADEKISCLSVDEAAQYPADSLCVVVIADE